MVLSFTYAAFNKERGVAPGLPSFEEVLKVYHPERINAETKVYGVVGDPVGHSHSPLVHNAAFRERNVNAVYVPFRVTRGHLPQFLDAFAAIPVEGYSVTIPHKEAAAQAASTKDETVTMTRAANTLIRKPHGYFAANTDYPALMAALTANLTKPDGPPLDLHKRMVLILGAGGVARAAAYALHRAGAIVHIANRTLDRAEKLADEVNGEAARLDRPAQGRLRPGYQCHAGRDAPEHRRNPVARRLPAAGDGRVSTRSTRQKRRC